MSRVTRKFFVITITGFLNSVSTSRQPRVILAVRSTGWYGSVIPESANSWGRHRGEESSFRRSSGASCLMKILDSKSRPADRPRYSWVGRA